MEVRTAAEPAAVQVSSERTSRQKAILVAGLLNSESTTLTQRDGDEPRHFDERWLNSKFGEMKLIAVVNRALTGRWL